MVPLWGWESGASPCGGGQIVQLRVWGSGAYVDMGRWALGSGASVGVGKWCHCEVGQVAQKSTQLYPQTLLTCYLTSICRKTTVDSEPFGA